MKEKIKCQWCCESNGMLGIFKDFTSGQTPKVLTLYLCRKCIKTINEVKSNVNPNMGLGNSCCGYDPDYKDKVL